MRISELARRTDVPVATLKFYLRKGMLMRGQLTAQTQAQYTDEHVARVQLIRALTSVAGLPLARVQTILELIDDPGPDPMVNMGQAVDQLPPYVEPSEPTATEDCPRARAALDQLGLDYDMRFAGIAQLEVAIQAVEDAGLDWNSDIVERYGRAMLQVATEEIAPLLTGEVEDATTYAVLGTAIYEPALLALRRIGHMHALRTANQPDPPEDDNPTS